MENTSRLTHFKREWLKDYRVIDRPMNKVELEVTSNVTEKNRINATEPGKSDKYIASLKAFAPDQAERIRELFLHREEVPIEETNGLFLTASIWDKGPDTYLPMKGEKVLVNIDYVPNREGVQVLRPTNLQAKAAEKAKAFDFSEFFGDEQPADVTNDRDVVQR